MTDTTAWLQDQPHETIERDGVRYTVLGTAHVSARSAEIVSELIRSGAYDGVAVELDANRLQAMQDPDRMARTDLVQVIREGKTALFAAHLALSAYQRRMAEKLQIEPGAELIAAVNAANEMGLPVTLIDRDIGVTFKRTSQALGWWDRAKLSSGLLAGIVTDEDISDDDIERLKEGDVLEASFNEFAAESPVIYKHVIAERDEYMACALREMQGPRNVLAVIGAGHLQGMSEHLRSDTSAPESRRLALAQTKPKSNIPWMTIILAVFLAGGFAIGFVQGGYQVGSELILRYVLFAMAGGALGAMTAGGHPLSILGGALSSPLTPLHPALASGTVSALIEAWIRKPTHADFMALRQDVQTIGGWWRNRVARTLVNFFMTSLGTAVGVWAATARMISQLVS